MEEHILNKFADDREQQKAAKQKLSRIKHQFKARWTAAHKKKDIFEKINKDWLNNETTLSLPTTGMFKI